MADRRASCGRTTIRRCQVCPSSARSYAKIDPRYGSGIHPILRTAFLGCQVRVRTGAPVGMRPPSRGMLSPSTVWQEQPLRKGPRVLLRGVSTATLRCTNHCTSGPLRVRRPWPYRLRTTTRSRNFSTKPQPGGANVDRARALLAAAGRGTGKPSRSRLRNGLLLRRNLRRRLWLPCMRPEAFALPTRRPPTHTAS